MPLHELFDLSGRAALVTGGSRGLGAAIATALAEAGAHVAITSTTEADITDRAAEIAEIADGQIIGIVGDVADEADCERVVAEVEGAFGRLDILVNNSSARSPSMSPGLGSCADPLTGYLPKPQRGESSISAPHSAQSRHPTGRRIPRRRVRCIRSHERWPWSGQISRSM
jgi:NAD(P)-dependent dehydrogenase (short-subunit alcohol dehydrogenase family)